MNKTDAWVRMLPKSLKEYLAQRPDASVFAENSLWLLTDKLVRIFFALTVGSWVARHLGPQAFGELTYAITFIAIFQGIANLGADGLIVRDLARAPERAGVLLGTTLQLRLASAGICWLAAMGLVHLSRPGEANTLLLVAIVGATLFFQSADTVDLWFQSQSQNNKSVSAKILAYGLSNAFRIALLLNDAPLWAYAFANLLDAALLAAALAIVYVRNKTARPWRGDWATGKDLLSLSWPFMLSGLAVLIYMRIDQIMIRHMLGETSLGLYSAAISLSQLWNVIPVALASALAPYISRKKTEGSEAYMRALQRVFRGFAVMSLTLSLATALLAPVLIQLLYGSAYAASAEILMVHVFTNVFVFMGVAQGLWLINEGFGMITLYRTCLGALISVGGNYLLIPHFGLLGAAVSTVIAMFVAAMGSNVLFAPTILRLQIRAFLPIKL